jgi:hypothetical protein
MSFRCPACSDKSYDKAWKLQRHIRESNRRFEQLNPGISRTRFQCSSCDYTSPREEDLRRHRRRVHPDIVTTTATDTEAAGQPTLGSHESSNVALCLQPEAQLDTNEHSDVFEADLMDLDVLSLACGKETSTPKTTENLDRISLVSRVPTARPTAPRTSAHNAKIQSIFSSSTGTPQSMSISCSSLGSLFGRPSKRVPELWMTWSSTSPGPASLKSLHSLGMPAPMLESIDEELLRSRGVDDPEKSRHRNHRATEVFVEDCDSDLDMSIEDNDLPGSVHCIFAYQGCPDFFTNLSVWMRHCKSHFWNDAPPLQLRCPYPACDWARSTRNCEDAWSEQQNHFDNEHDMIEHDVLIFNEGLSKDMMRRCLGFCGVTDGQMQ